MDNPVVKQAGSKQIDFAHACDRIEYWKEILKLTEINHFKELNEFMESKSTGCIEEWQYIKSVLCPNHNMKVINQSSKYIQTMCETCGYIQFIRSDI